jgi:hypothetical protein
MTLLNAVKKILFNININIKELNEIIKGIFCRNRLFIAFKKLCRLECLSVIIYINIIKIRQNKKLPASFTSIG